MMQDNYNIGENINNIFGKLESFLKTKTVVGEPMQIGEITLVPFIDISFGMGSGGGVGAEQQSSNQGSGGAAGSGGRISPTAVLVIKGGQVELMPFKNYGYLEKLMDMVPDILEKVKEYKNQKYTEE